MRRRCGSALASAMFLAFVAGCANQPPHPEPTQGDSSCPAGSNPATPWIAVVSRDQPLAVQMQVRGDYDPGSAVALMAERGGRTASKWIVGGLVLGNAIATGAKER